MQQTILVEAFLYKPSLTLYNLIEDQRVARSLMNRDSTEHLYFLYKNGYITKVDVVLSAAIKENRMDIFRELIDTCGDFDELAEVSAGEDNLPITYELIGRSKEDDILCNVIQGASKYGNTDLVTKMIDRSNQYQVDYEDEDFHYYIRSGKLEGGYLDNCVYYRDYFFLARGGHLDLIKKHQEPYWDQIMCGAVEGNHLGIIKYAIGNGADPNLALSYAVEHCRVNIIHYLENFTLDWSHSINAAKDTHFTDMKDYVKERVTDEQWSPVKKQRTERLNSIRELEDDFDSDDSFL